MDRKVYDILVVVDYQKDFVDGALGFEGAEKLDAKIVDRINDILFNPLLYNILIILFIFL